MFFAIGSKLAYSASISAYFGPQKDVSEFVSFQNHAGLLRRIDIPRARLVFRLQNRR